MRTQKFCREEERAGGFSSASSMRVYHCHSYTEEDNLPAPIAALAHPDVCTRSCHCSLCEQVPAQPMYQPPAAAVPTVCCPSSTVAVAFASAPGTIRVALLPIPVFQGSQSAYVPEHNCANPHHGSLPPHNGVDLRAWHIYFFVMHACLCCFCRRCPPTTKTPPASSRLGGHLIS